MSDHNDHEDHGDLIYVKIFLFLVALTGVEVFMYFESVHQLSDVVIRIILIALMVIKFVLVGGYFMHLKSDNSFFTQVFVAGLIIAWPVYFAVAYAFGFLPDWAWFWKVIVLLVPPMVAGAFLAGWRSGENKVEDSHPLSPIGGH